MPGAFDPSAAAYEEAFARAPVGMALIGLDSRFRQVNDAFCAIVGRSRDELVGMPAGTVTHPDDRAADAERMTAPNAGELDGRRWQKRYLHSSGRTVWAEVSTVLVRDAGGTPRHFITQIADVSDRRRAERLKEEFLATISHELRTPLTSIQGYSDLLAEEEELSQGARRRAIAAIQRNAERLRRLVEDVQLIAQARAESLSMSRIDVQLDRVVLECVEWAATRGADLGLTLTVDAEPVRLHADADRLAQAVDHLLSNALHYTPRGGRVDVRLARDGDHAVVQVADSGIGLSGEDAEHLFEHFYRAPDAVDAAVQGVGLGLSVVKAIVDLHGGRVEVDSRPGAGTTFRLLLPLVPTAVAAR